MDIQKLKELLDIESGEDLKYFESFSELMEMDEEVSADLIATALKGVDFDLFSDLAETWFDDIIEHLPEDSDELIQILDAEKRYFLSLCGSALQGEKDGEAKLWTEIERFREWFSLGEKALIHDHQLGESYKASISEALGEYRYSKLINKNIDIGFSEAEEFIVEEYIVPIEELM